MIIGHQKQWQFLKRSVEMGNLSHAYLFSGQEKLGKKTLAFEFVKLLNCQNPNLAQKPCQECASCQEIQKSLISHTEQHPDLIIVEPKEFVSRKSSLKKEEIKISQIRELMWKLSLRPFSAPFKTLIIDKAHRMNQEAQSCFLKTLEEPKGNAILILITEYPRMLLSTILSRVQEVKFYPLTLQEIEISLKARGLVEKEAKELSLISFGKPGVILDFLASPQRLENQKQKINDLIKITAENSNLASRFQYAKNFSLESKDLKEILEVWLRYFRGVLLNHFEKEPHLEKRSVSFNRYSVLKLGSIIKLIQNIIFLASTTNINPRLALEVLMLEL